MKTTYFNPQNIYAYTVKEIERIFTSYPENSELYFANGLFNTRTNITTYRILNANNTTIGEVRVVKTGNKKTGGLRAEIDFI